MGIDLYKADLARISSAELYEAVKSFTRVDEDLDQRPREGYVLDFKQEWGDKALQTVAAFATTFGGLLLIGVSENDGRPDKCVGVQEKGELKTRLASIIAGNMVPVPPFWIADCRLPQDATRSLAAVRVGQSKEVCLITKKGESHPVYVRFEDQSVPANAAQLRSLIDKEKRAIRPEGYTARRANEFQNTLNVYKKRAQGSGIEGSQTFFRVFLVPDDHPRIEIDLTVENRFRETVYRNFQGHKGLLSGTAAEDTKGPKDSFLMALTLSPAGYDYERRWAFTASGDVGFVTQSVMNVGELGAR
ncbi:MAG: hypothetical protein DMG22_23210 [Acidobacteria bacterium]|nr:MAG: hypothetical protein DMG22_23210 [Acidobacteriota bacterium]